MKRIIGRFDKQRWAGRHEDNAVSIGEVEFDATERILGMKLWEIHELKDCDESSDYLGQEFIKHDGPHSVYIEDAIQAFFEVSDVKKITQNHLNTAIREMEAEPLVDYAVDVNRAVVQTRTIIVQARSPGDAINKALARAGDVDFTGCDGDPEYDAETARKIG